MCTKVKVVEINTLEQGNAIITSLLNGTEDRRELISIADAINKSTIVIDNHDGKDYDLSTGKYVIYSYSNGDVGLGFLNQIHSINSLHVGNDGMMHLSHRSIGVTVSERISSVHELADYIQIKSNDNKFAADVETIYHINPTKILVGKDGDVIDIELVYSAMSIYTLTTLSHQNNMPEDNMKLSKFMESVLSHVTDSDIIAIDSYDMDIISGFNALKNFMDGLIIKELDLLK